MTPRLACAVAVVAVLVAGSPVPAASEPGRVQVRLVPLGKFPARLLGAIESTLREELGAEVGRAPVLGLPRAAYHPTRRRYRAERLLGFLRARYEALPEGTRILGLTTVDISTTKGAHADWGVFGLGELGGRAAVVSTFRLRWGARGPAQLRFRLVTSALHEVGHTLGLDHCEERRCVMLDARGTIRSTDASDGHLGPRCKARLRNAPL